MSPVNLYQINHIHSTRFLSYIVSLFQYTCMCRSPSVVLGCQLQVLFSFFLSVFLHSCLSVLVCLCLCLRAGLFTKSRLRPNTPVLSDDLAKKSLLKVLAEDQSSLSYSVKTPAPASLCFFSASASIDFYHLFPEERILDSMDRMCRFPSSLEHNFPCYLVIVVYMYYFTV